jgi:hypothetical protein
MPTFHTVYVCEYGTFWKFTTKEWWSFATKTIRNQAQYELPSSRALRNPPRSLPKNRDGGLCSNDESVRLVCPLEWTLEDWTGEIDTERDKIKDSDGVEC